MRRYKTIEVQEYEMMLKAISNYESFDLEDYDLLLYGGGGQTKSFYSSLKNRSDCELLWTGWSGPKWTKIFSFIPGQAGLIKVADRQVFMDLYYDLAAQSVSDAIYAPKELTNRIINEAKNKTWAANFEKYVQQAPKSFLLTSEADEIIHKNGKAVYFYDYSFGSSVDLEIRRIIERKNDTR